MIDIPSTLQAAIRHHQSGQFMAAEAEYLRILAVAPNHTDALHLLGAVYYQSGRTGQAVDYITRALRTDPSFAEAHSNLGLALMAQGFPHEAVASFRRALELKPNYAEAHNNLGVTLQQQGLLEEAIANCRRATELKPSFAQAHNNLGNALQELGQLDQAIASFRRALELAPNYTEAHYNLGNALQKQGKLDQAIASFRRALELNPNYAEAHINLGNALRELGDIDDAMANCRRALALQPDSVMAYNNLGLTLKEQRHLDEAVASYRRALELKPNSTLAHSNLLFALQYRAGVTLSELAAAHAEFDRRHAEPLRLVQPQHANVRDPQRRLRMGFVSPDFGRHPVGYFLVRVLENFDRDQADTVCYSDGRIQDDLTIRLKAAATVWRDVFDRSDEQLAAQIREDRIDVLFDLAGHTAKNRLLVFARKPAPIQVTWAGYVGTTGIKTMDYILADRYQIPADAEPYYCEKVLRMPDGYVCFDPPSDAPPISPLPALDETYVTFGSFNNPAKISGRTVEVWAEILRRLPRSRLVLKYKGISDLSVAQGLAEEFARHKVDPVRVECLGRSDHARMLAEYQRVDVALDPIPYNGGVTTCEALWMGVPVVTCPGETFASRHSLSHLSNVGLTRTIARTLDEYVELAVALASDLPRLAEMRAGLRQRMAASPLCDGNLFAANLMTLLRKAWQQWLAQGSK